MNGNPNPNYPEANQTGANAGTPFEGAATGSYNTTDANSYAAGSAYPGSSAGYTGPTGDAYTAPGYVPPPPGYAPPYPPPIAPPPVPGAPNPGLATLLGFIPGVGAMYNGQFAKGIAHIVVFSILTSLSSHAHDPLDMIFGLLTAGWYFYMVFDAYQTARARRDGLIAPDPFGLNNIGERFGMPANPNWGEFVARPAAGAAPSADSARTSNPYAGGPTDTAASAPVGSYSYTDPAAAGAVPPYSYSPNAGTPYAGVPPASYPPGTMPPPWHPDYSEALRRQTIADMGGTPNAAYQGTYAPVGAAAVPPVPPQPSSGIPTGAIWLICLGVLALIGSIAHSVYWTGRYFGGIIPIALGIGIIVQRALAAKKFYPEGSAAHRWYILHQSRFGVLLIVVGGLTLLNNIGLLYWSHTWPYLLILFGLLQVADRAAYNRMLSENPPPFGTPYTPQAPVTSADSATSAPNGQEVR